MLLLAFGQQCWCSLVSSSTAPFADCTAQHLQDTCFGP
jgi:hypothetical protein